MSFAHMHDDPDTLPRPDARERINDARVSEVAFVVRQIAKTLDDDDVIMMAQIIVRTLDAHQPLSRGDLERELRAAGRSPAKAAQLSSAIFK